MSPEKNLQNKRKNRRSNIQVTCCHSAFSIHLYYKMQISWIFFHGDTRSIFNSFARLIEIFIRYLYINAITLYTHSLFKSNSVNLFSCSFALLHFIPFFFCYCCCCWLRLIFFRSRLLYLAIDYFVWAIFFILNSRKK